MKRWNMAAIVVGAFIAGEMDPAGFVFWKIAEWQLPKYKRVSLQKPSPFQTITSDRYVGESENAFAVDDTKPRAPVHTLVVPKERIPTLLEASPELLGEMLELAKKTARKKGIAEEGFRIVINTNPRGAQTVYHLHIHVLGGRQMRWPPG
jgi:histidine triad (HIT) family protein